MIRASLARYLTLATLLPLAGCDLRENPRGPSGPSVSAIPVTGLRAEYDTLAGVARLAWDEIDSDDLLDYVVYRRGDSDRAEETEIGRTALNRFADTVYPGDRRVRGQFGDTATYAFRYAVAYRSRAGEVKGAAEPVRVVAAPPRLARTYVLLANAGGRDTLSLGDSLAVRVEFRNATRTIHSLAYLAAGGARRAFPLETPASQGSAILKAAWSDTGRHVLHVLAEDGSDDPARDSLVVQVIEDAPEAHAGADRTVVTNGTVRLQGGGSDRYGAIARYEWKIGPDGDFRPAPGGLATFQAPAAETDGYPCVLRVTDDDGVSALDTVLLSARKVVIASPRANEMVPNVATVTGEADPGIDAVRVRMGNGEWRTAKEGGAAWSADLETGYLHPAYSARVAVSALDDGEEVFRSEFTVRLAGEQPYWQLVGGDGSFASWDGGAPVMEEVRVLQEHAGYLYAGLLSAAAEMKGQVWRFDGTAWEKVGGSGVRGSWRDGEVMSANALASDGKYLYAGTGIHQGMAHVWRFDGEAWEKIGGDSLNGSWGPDLDCVWHLSVHKGEVYAGLVGEDYGIQRAPLYRFDGTRWHLMTGEDGERGGWGRDEGYMMCYISVSDGTDLYVGLAGRNASNGKVWRYDGSRFETVGGGGAGGWSNPAATFVEDAIMHDGRLHVALNGTYSDSRREIPIWTLDGNTWKTVGDVPAEWESPDAWIYNKLHSFNGELYLGVGGRARAASMWKLRDNGTWAKIGGGGIAGSDWNMEGSLDHTLWVYTIATYKDEMYIGLSSAETRGMAQVWRYRPQR